MGDAIQIPSYIFFAKFTCSIMRETMVEQTVGTILKDDRPKDIDFLFYIFNNMKGVTIMKKRGLFGLIVDFILVLLTGGLWLIWILIRYLRNS